MPSYCRLWKLEAGKNVTSLRKYLKDEIIGLRLSHSDPSVAFPGSLLENSTVIEDAEIAFDDVVVLEMKSASSTWSFHDPKTGPDKKIDYSNINYRNNDRK